VIVAIVVLALAFMLLTFPQARAAGTSLLASAGILGVIVGVAARSTVGNLIAGLQIAFAEPIRCEVRERLLAWLQQQHPGALPRLRAQLETPAPGRRPHLRPSTDR